MAVTGRKPKPTVMKKLEGNPGNRPLNENEPKPKSGIPPCPRWLNKAAKKEWKRICPILDTIGLLTHADMAVVALYCQAYARFAEAEAILTKLGTTYEYTNKAGETNTVKRPEVNIAKDYSQIIKSTCVELGLTPSSRGRIRLPSEDDDDPFEADFE